MFAFFPNHSNLNVASRIAMIRDDQKHHTFCPQWARFPLLPGSVLCALRGLFHFDITLTDDLAPVAPSLSGFGRCSDDYGSSRHGVSPSWGRTAYNVLGARFNPHRRCERELHSLARLSPADSSRRENRGSDGGFLPQCMAGVFPLEGGGELDDCTWLHAARQKLSSGVKPGMAVLRPLPTTSTISAGSEHGRTTHGDD